MTYLANNTNLIYGPKNTNTNLYNDHISTYIHNQNVWETYETVHVKYDSVKKHLTNIEAISFIC